MILPADAKLSDPPTPQPPGTASAPTGQGDQPAEAPPNLYTQQLREQQRALEAARRAQGVVRLRQSAERAAFDSLMRRRRSTDARLEEFGLFTPAAAVTRAFECAVAERLARAGMPSLPHTEREALFREAASLGISRFDATLLIARVQHYQSRGSGRRRRPSARRRRPNRDRARALALWAAAMSVALVVQVVLLALWLTLLQR